jgi:hypothetical protein
MLATFYILSLLERIEVRVTLYHDRFPHPSLSQRARVKSNFI